MHRFRVRVPASEAQVLRHEPCLISLAVERFYDRHVDSMKYAAKMERFLIKRRERERERKEELVLVLVKMPRAMNSRAHALEVSATQVLSDAQQIHLLFQPIKQQRKKKKKIGLFIINSEFETTRLGLLPLDGNSTMDTPYRDRQRLQMKWMRILRLLTSTSTL